MYGFILWTGDAEAWRISLEFDPVTGKWWWYIDKLCNRWKESRFVQVVDLADVDGRFPENSANPPSRVFFFGGSLLGIFEGILSAGSNAPSF